MTVYKALRALQLVLHHNAFERMLLCELLPLQMVPSCVALLSLDKSAGRVTGSVALDQVLVSMA